MQTAQNSTDLPKSVAATVFPQLKPGDRLAGCYVLNGEKYSSGTTTIWHAQDEVLAKDVALHFIPQSIRSDDKAMDALRQLTKRNRQLIHPNILRIYDFIEDDGWAAISTDPVEGDCVAELRRARTGGHFEVAEIKPWLAQLCQTLDDAHKIQLVHGDVSPEHLFVDKRGRLQVSNFGIGRCVRDAVWRAKAPGGGTAPIENLSPQMLDGQAPAVADDLYSTGVLLHELLVGQPPFTDPDLSSKIRNVPAPKVLERRAELQKAGGPVPPVWEKAVAACLDKAAEQRPKNLADLSVRLTLPKSNSKAEESVAPEKAVEAVSDPAKMGGEPEIPVVKKAWVGATASAPVFGGAVVAKGRRADSKGDAKEVDMSDSVESLDDQATVRNSLADGSPSNRSRRSGFPVTGVAAAALLGGLCVYAAVSGGFRKDAQADPDPVIHTVSAGDPEYAPVRNPIVESPGETNSTAEPKPDVEPVPESVQAAPVVAIVASAPPIAPATELIPLETQPFPPKPEIETALTLVANTKPPKKSATAVATPIPAAVSAGSTVSAKAAALEETRRSVEEWEKAHATMLKKKDQAEAAIAVAKRALDEKMKTVGPMLKASEEVAAMKQQREEAMRAAELAAAEAKKAAEEKARLADEAKKAVINVEKDNREKLVGQKQAEAELDEIKKVIAENERLAAESVRLAEGAMAKKTEQAALVKQKEQEVAMAMAAAEIETQKKREMEEKRGRIMKEMDEAKRLFEERMKALESSLKDPDPGTISPKPPIEKAPAEIKPAAPAVPTSPPPGAANTPPPAPTVEVSKPVAASATPTLPAADSTLLAKMEKPPVVPTIEPKEPATSTGITAVNSLGIRFVPVGDVQFAVWPTRLKDFEAFATATGLKSNLWRDPGFKQGPDHPVVNVTWMEAMAFCKWLTFKEQREGTLPAGKAYRLPTDLEWSRAVGLPEESGKTAEARDMGVPDVYPWGTTWPPPQGAGNYTGEETGSDVAIKNYSDGFPWTSPVGSFPPNKSGIADMGGNVWQWVMDPWNTDSNSKVLRGASWYNGALKLSLLSSCRVHAAQDSSTDNYGFRCVIAAESPKAAKR